MNKSYIKIAFKQIITSASQSDFEKNVWNDTYDEFLIQSQAYNHERKYKTLEEIISRNPKANSIHYKVGFAIGLYVNDLDKQIPGLYDSLGRANVQFETYKFEIVTSDITNKATHKLSITYQTDIMLLYATIGDYLLLSASSITAEPDETFLLKMQDNLSIVSYREII